jgi:polysaccharide biosynthesis protein PslH
VKVLMLGRWLPLARRAGAGNREYDFARHLAREHRVTVAFTTDDADDVYGPSMLRQEFGDIEFAVVPRGWKYLTGAISLATGDSCTLAYFRSPALSARLADRMKTGGYDLVYVSSSSMIQYALELDPGVPLLVDFGEVDSEWWRSQADLRSFPGANFYRTEAARLRTAEAAAAARASACIVTNPQAGAAVAQFAPWAPLTVIPTGAGPASDVDNGASGAGDAALADLDRLVALVTRGGGAEGGARIAPSHGVRSAPELLRADLGSPSTNNHLARPATEQRSRA